MLRKCVQQSGDSIYRISKDIRKNTNEIEEDAQSKVCYYLQTCAFSFPQLPVELNSQIIEQLVNGAVIMGKCLQCPVFKQHKSEMANLQ